jgi:uncharacterized coiled-coil DUF342 family protein
VTDHEKIDRLRKRADHLAARILQAKAAGRDLSYDRSELSALLWAIEIIETMLTRKE